MSDHIWHKLSGESVFYTPYYRITRDRLRHPRGHELDYYVLHHHRQAAGVVPVGGDGRILLVQEWRHPVQKLLWAIPAGGIDEGESPADAAARELREEAGHAARGIEPLLNYHPSVGTADQTFHLFTASGVEPIPRTPGLPDPTSAAHHEVHAVAWFTRGEVERMVDANDLVDGLSLTALLFYLRRTDGPSCPR